MMLLVIAIILVILLVSMTTYEHMTNKDVLSAMKNLGVDDTSSETRSGQSSAPIYGPGTSGIKEDEPSANGKDGEYSNRMYPDIFGPDLIASPGTKNIKRAKPGQNESDVVESDEDYDYNIDLRNAFPTDGPPEPFLGDFSSFHS